MIYGYVVVLKGKLSVKKLQSMANSLNSSSSDLGPCASDGLFKLPSGATVSLTPCFLDQLSPGVNAGKIIIGKVVCSFNIEDAVSL